MRLELIKAKMCLYEALLKIPPEEKNFIDSDFELMHILSRDKDIQDVLQQRLDDEQP